MSDKAKTEAEDIVEEMKAKIAEADAQEAGEQAADPESAATSENAEGAEQAAESAEPTVESLQAELEQAQAAAEEAKDQALRATAEAQNARRRAENEAEKARKFALERFAKDMLPVVDNLERGLAAMDSESEELKAAIEGVELTLKSLQDALKRHNIEVVNPLGEPFDPQLHEAVAMVPNPSAEPNSVIDVVQKGYTLNDRLLRAAMVAVAQEAK